MGDNKQALSYLRVSGQGQVGGDGFPRQRLAVETFAKAHGLSIVDEFRDEGVSGTRELDEREGLAALMDRIESNGVRVVLVERADRLARDLIVGEIILAKFRDLGVQVIAAESGTELTVGDQDPTKKLIRQILGAFSEYDKNVTVLKLRAARERIRRRGERCEGRKPFGFHPAEAETLDLMRKLRRKPRNGARLSFADIAAELNSRGIVTRTGKAWSKALVLNVLGRAG